MKKRGYSIRTISLFIFSLLTVLIAVQAGYDVLKQWQRLTKIETLREASVLSDRLFAGIESLSIERDAATTLLRASKEEATENLYLRLKESRERTDDAMQTALQALKIYHFAELDPMQEKILSGFSDIQAMRLKIDEAMTVPLGAREKNLERKWQENISAMLTQTQDLWTGFIRHFTDIDPIVTQHLRYKHLLRIITDYTGRERAIIGRLIVENADPTPKEFAELLHGQGVIELGWMMNRLLADQSGLYPAVDVYYKEAQSHYQNLHGMVRDIFYLPGAKRNSPYPIGADLWLELSTQATESLDDLKAASVTETQRYVKTLENDSWRTITLQGLFFLFVLLFCAYSFRVIGQRVLSPIEQMIDALLAAMRGEPSRALPAQQTDEIGKLARVLAVFQENQQRYRALVEASSQIIWTWKEGALDKASPLAQWWEKTTGQPAENIATFGWLDVVHKEDRERVKEIWEKTMAERKNFEMEYRLRAKTGKYLHVAVRGVVLLNKDGSVREFIGSLNDITHRREAEEALKDYTHALERSNKELDDFAYIASHDLKEPLRGIHNHSRFLLEDNQGKLDEESIRKLTRLVYLSQRMERLVNDLLYFSRLGRQELAIQSTDLNEVIRDITDTLEQFFTERHAEIKIPKPLPTITCDKPRVTELFRNLITNAVKYNDSEKKIIEIGFLPSRVTPQGASYRNVFYVKDNGRGIAPEFHEEVYRIFKRLQNSAEGAEEGTGVGLTFVKKIVERHGGKIWLESELGQGTTFYFTLEETSHDRISVA